MGESVISHPLELIALNEFRRWMIRGDQPKAETSLRQMLHREPNLPGVHLTLARLRWSGPDYLAWLAWIHHRLKPGLYLEIGVESGRSLALAGAKTQVIAIDPEPQGDPLQNCTAATQLYRQTSADFFSKIPQESGLQQRGFDLAFIDGDHRFESALDDFIALERHAASEAFILLHDTLPLSENTSNRVRQTGFYSGDVWKIVPCLRALRPDLKITTLPTAPTGLTVVTGLDAQSSLLSERRHLITEVYGRLPSATAINNPDELLSIGKNDPGWFTDWLENER